MDDTKRALLPSEREAIEAETKRKQDERAAARVSSMRQDFTRTFQSQSGKRVLAWLKERSGFGKIILSANAQSGSIDPMSTTFAAMELNLYLEIRRHLPIPLLQEIEYGSIEPSGTVSDPDTGSTVERKSNPAKRKR